MSEVGPFVTRDGVTLGPTDVPLRAGILSVGSELLLGDLVDTNATWLCQRMGELGIDVRHALAARDDLDELVEVIRWLADRVHVLVIGGGLGPTADDLTREAVAAATGLPLENRDDLEEAIVERFASFGRRMPAQNLRQARVPTGADAFPPLGTAPAFAVTTGGAQPTRVFALPGVPWELHGFWERDVAPELLALAGRGATLTRRIHVIGRGESDVAELVEPLLSAWPDATLAFLAKAGEIQVRITVTADDADMARTASQPIVEEVIRALGSSVAAVDEESLETVIVRLLRETGTTLATAESATAGDIVARIGRVPGASAGLLGGVVVYAAGAKQEILDVDAAALAKHGPVSEPTTEALALGARSLFGSDWAVAVTGVAGPEPVGDVRVGVCYWALADPAGAIEVHGRRIPGDRREIIARLGSAALDLLRRRLLEWR